MKKFYEQIEAEFIVYEAQEVLLASGNEPLIGDGEGIIGGDTGIGNV